MEKPFTIAPRVIAHLGEDLIKNESIALLELVKNAYDAYASMFPDKIEAAKVHKHAKINGDCMFYTVSDMGGIRIDSNYNEPTWDILSLEFREHKRLILVPDGVNTINPDK